MLYLYAAGFVARLWTKEGLVSIFSRKIFCMCFLFSKIWSFLFCCYFITTCPFIWQFFCRNMEDCQVYGVIHFVTCGLTAFTPGLAPGPTLGNEYGKTLPLPLLWKTIFVIDEHCIPSLLPPRKDTDIFLRPRGHSYQLPAVTHKPHHQSCVLHYLLNYI